MMSTTRGTAKPAELYYLGSAAACLAGVLSMCTFCPPSVKRSMYIISAVQDWSKSSNVQLASYFAHLVTASWKSAADIEKTLLNGSKSIATMFSAVTRDAKYCTMLST
ncbi:hypothetical protein PAPHI01_2620 [Pancytospora philotis]|nr:hypothetical protein PAPHI01_2620 [Pancytospora philotis]